MLIFIYIYKIFSSGTSILGQCSCFACINMMILLFYHDCCNGESEHLKISNFDKPSRVLQVCKKNNVIFMQAKTWEWTLRILRWRLARHRSQSVTFKMELIFGSACLRTLQSLFSTSEKFIRQQSLTLRLAESQHFNAGFAERKSSVGCSSFQGRLYVRLKSGFWCAAQSQTAW